MSIVYITDVYKNSDIEDWVAIIIDGIIKFFIHGNNLDVIAEYIKKNYSKNEILITNYGYGLQLKKRLDKNINIKSMGCNYRIDVGIKGG